MPPKHYFRTPIWNQVRLNMASQNRPSGAKKRKQSIGVPHLLGFLETICSKIDSDWFFKLFESLWSNRGRYFAALSDLLMGSLLLLLFWAPFLNRLLQLSFLVLSFWQTRFWHKSAKICQDQPKERQTYTANRHMPKQSTKTPSLKLEIRNTRVAPTTSHRTNATRLDHFGIIFQVFIQNH